MAALIVYRDVAAEMADIAALANEPVGFKVLDTLSHVGFLVALIVAVRHRFWLAATITLFTLVVSEGYHVCSFFGACAGLSLFIWRMFDHITANLPILLLIMTPIYAADVFSHNPYEPLHSLRSSHGQRRFIEIASTCWTLAVVFAQLAFPFSYYVSYTALLAGLTAVLLWAFFFRQPAFRRPDATSYAVDPAARVHVPKLVAAAVLAVAGIAFFLVPASLVATSWPHSLWHLAVGLGLALYLDAFLGYPDDGGDDGDDDDGTACCSSSSSSAHYITVDVPMSPVGKPAAAARPHAKR